jgi:hypothetical protein
MSKTAGYETGVESFGCAWEVNELTQCSVENTCPQENHTDYGVELEKCQLHPIQGFFGNDGVFVDEQPPNS